jgi:hypothetical protein
MNRSHDKQTTGGEATVAEWIRRSAPNGSARAFAMLQLPLSELQPHHVNDVWNSAQRPQEKRKLTSFSADAIKSALDEMEEMADLYLAAGHFYNDAGIKQLRTLRSLKKLVAMRGFKMKSVALREEIAQKYTH